MHLITGFSPFRGAKLNPARQMAHHVAPLVGAEVVDVPTTFGGASAALHAHMAGRTPSSILMLGRAASEPGVRLEQFGRRDATSPHPDNDGVVGRGPHVVGGPVSLPTTVDLQAVYDDVTIKVPGSRPHISTDAGGYVCNALYYETLYTYPGVPALFVHFDGLHFLDPAADPLATGDDGRHLDTPDSCASWADLTDAVRLIAEYLQR